MTGIYWSYDNVFFMNMYFLYYFCFINRKNAPECFRMPISSIGLKCIINATLKSYFEFFLCRLKYSEKYRKITIKKVTFSIHGTLVSNVTDVGPFCVI